MSGFIHRARKMFISSRIWRTLIRSHQIRWVGLLTCVLVLLTIVIAGLEAGGNERFTSIGDVIYWAFVTITTVGYGDITPRTTGGEILTIGMILIGVVLVSTLTATIASIMTATRIREGMGLKKVELQNHIVICGFNANLERVIRGIINSSSSSLPDIVLVNTQPENEVTELIERFPETPVRFVFGDYTQEATLNRASVTKASSVIVLAECGPTGTDKPDDRTLLTVLALKSMSQDVRVCVELLEQSSEVNVKRAGVDQIVLSGEFSGFLLSSSVMSPGIPQVLKEMMFFDLGTNIRRHPIPPELVGSTFKELSVDFLDRFDAILVGIITEKKTFNLETILSGDKGAIDDFIHRKFEEAGRDLSLESKGRMSVMVNPGKEYVVTPDDIAVVVSTRQEKTV